MNSKEYENAKRRHRNAAEGLAARFLSLAKRARANGNLYVALKCMEAYHRNMLQVQEKA